MRSLENYTLSVAVLNTSFFRVYQEANGDITGIKGRDYLMLETLALLLGFKYKLVLPKDKQYGVHRKTGEWNGIIGMLRRGEVDISADPMALNVDRQKAVNISFVTKQDFLVYVTKNMATANEDNFFGKPFDEKVWITIMIILILPFLLSTTVRIFFPRFKRKFRKVTFWNIAASCIGLGKVTMTFSPDVEHLSLTFYIFLFGCLSKIYSSMLTSSLKLSLGANQIQSVSQLAEAVLQKDYSVGFLQGHDIIKSFLRKSEQEDLQIIFRHMHYAGSKIILPFPEAFEAIKNGNYALIIGLDTFLKLMNENDFPLSDVYISTDPVVKYNKALGYSSKFKYRNVFDEMLRRIVTFGLIEKWEKKEQYKNERELTKKKEAEGELISFITMADLYQIFLILLAVAGISFVVLLLEILNMYKKY